MLFLCAYGYHKRETIKAVCTNLLSGGSSSAVPTEAELRAFNNEPLSVKNDSVMTGDDKTLTILFLGNSLTMTGVPKEEKDKTQRGLTTTAPDSDYVHRLVKRIAIEQNVNVKYSVTNITQFERTFIRHPFNFSKLDSARVKQPDILIVQIGENIFQEDLKSPEIFEKSYLHLLSFFPHAKRIITLPFWQEKVRDYAITDVATRSNSWLVDLGHLGGGMDKDNFASSQKNYKNPAVGQHPGDKGMKRIADCYYATVNAILQNK